MHTPRRRPAGEIAFTLLLVAASLYMLWTAYGISGFASLTSAGAFPMVATAVMVLTGIANVVHALRERPTDTRPGESLPAKFMREITPGVLIGFGVAIVAYMLLLDRLGFLLASYLFLVVSMGLLGSRRIGLNLGVSALCLAAIYAIFQTVFSVVLPKGTWLQAVLS